MSTSRCLALLAALGLGTLMHPDLSQADPANANVATASVRLRWTAPGDDGAAGRATAYDLRYSTSPITAANFAQATLVNGEPAPAVAGSAESFTVYGLSDGVTYFFAIRTQDDAGNWSQVSNTATRAATVSASDSELTLMFAPPAPNPARGPTRFSFALPQAAEVKVDAYDIQGRHVRTLIQGSRPAGRDELVWDLKDDSGRAINAGVYLVRGRLGDRTFNHRVVVVQ